MISYWLDKLLANDDVNNLGKFAPLVIFFVIWLFGAIAKAAQKGKKGTDTETGTEEYSGQGQKKHEPGFDGLAKKIRERYAEAQKEAGREVQQEENEQFPPPVRSPQPQIPPPRRPEPRPIRKPAYPIQSMPEQERPEFRVAKCPEKPDVGTPLPVDKPTLQKVELALQRVNVFTSENAKVSSEVKIHYRHPYLAELAKQYATQDGFRKAILNYEILGPPLALRDYVYCGATEAR